MTADLRAIWLDDVAAANESTPICAECAADRCDDCGPGGLCAVCADDRAGWRARLFGRLYRMRSRLHP